MKISAGRFQMVLSLSETLSKEGPQTTQTLAQLMPYWTPNSNVALLDDAVLIGASIGLFDQSGPNISLATGWLTKRTNAASNVEFARFVLLKVVKVHFPELIAFSFLPIRKLRNEIDGNIRAILDDCRLLEVDLDTGAAEWWERLRSLGQFRQDDSKKQIGTDAEKLTLAYEVSLLRKHGVPQASEHVSWVAEHNDMAGFDVLSMNLGRDNAFGPELALQIEVKVGRREEGQRFSVMFTRHENRVMAAGSMPWILHVWLYKPGIAQFEEAPITIGRDHVRALIPETVEEFEWETARLTFEAL